MIELVFLWLYLPIIVKPSIPLKQVFRWYHMILKDSLSFECWCHDAGDGSRKHLLTYHCQCQKYSFQYLGMPKPQLWGSQKLFQFFKAEPLMPFHCAMCPTKWRDVLFWERHSSVSNQCHLYSWWLIDQFSHSHLS